MFDEIERFVNWIHRRNPGAHTWQDYRGDLQQFAATVGDRSPTAVTPTPPFSPTTQTTAYLLPIYCLFTAYLIPFTTYLPDYSRSYPKFGASHFSAVSTSQPFRAA